MRFIQKYLLQRHEKIHTGKQKAEVLLDMYSEIFRVDDLFINVVHCTSLFCGTSLYTETTSLGIL